MNNIIKLFGGTEVIGKRIREEYNQVEICTKIEKPLFPLSKIFFGELSFLNKRDSLHIRVSQDDETIITYSSKRTSEFDDFISSYSQAYDDSFPVEIEFTIEKKLSDHTISIYYINEFVEYLTSLPFDYFLDVIHKNKNDGVSLFFEIQDSSTVFELKTESILISNKKQGISGVESKRLEQNSKIRNVCNCNLLTKYEFIPEDFYLLRKSGSEDIDNTFMLASFVYSVIYLFDIVNVEEDSIDFKLNGYKTLFHKVRLSDIEISSCEYYFKIYDWAYEGGSLIDKIGLARNIISLNINHANLSIVDTTFHAIQSSFKIYQKENIKQYIEIRNKISDQLIEIQNKADKIVEDFISDFKKSIFTFVSFFASVLVIRVVTKGNLKGGFSKEITYLSIAFLLISLIVMLVRNNEIKKQKDRYKQYYKNMKVRYLDLLDNNDITRILNNDTDFNENIKYIEKRVFNYVILWLLSVLVFFAVVVFLYNPEL